MVRALTAGGWAHLLQWLDDVVPGQDDRKGPPRFDAADSQQALASPEGQVLELWLALEDQGVSYEAATELWKESVAAERNHVHRVLFAHRRTAEPVTEPVAETEGDISETWCSKGLAGLAQTIGLEELSRYTLDQLEWMMRSGEGDLNPAYAPEKLRKIQDDMMTKWGDKLALFTAAQAKPTNGHAPGVPIG
jgi:hypothetical protein